MKQANIVLARCEKLAAIKQKIEDGGNLDGNDIKACAALKPEDVLGYTNEERIAKLQTLLEFIQKDLADQISEIKQDAEAAKKLTKKADKDAHAQA